MPAGLKKACWWRPLMLMAWSSRVINDLARGANSTLTAIMARMAAYTGQTVTWEQAMNSAQRLGPERYELGEAPPVSVAIPGRTRLV